MYWASYIHVTEDSLIFCLLYTFMSKFCVSIVMILKSNSYINIVNKIYQMLHIMLIA